MIGKRSIAVGAALFALAAIGAAAPAVSAESQTPRTLKVKEARSFAKSGLRADYTLKRYTSRCERRSRLRVRCRARWRDDFDVAHRATIDVSRGGTFTDDRERFRAIVRRRGKAERSSGDIIEPTRFARIGEALTLIGQDAGRVRVTPNGPFDPVPTGEFDQPPPGTRYVAITLALTNVGAGRFEDALRNGGKLITADGRTIDAAIVVSPPCDQGDAEIPERETRIGCLAFEVPFGTALRAFEYGPNSGFAPETGQWRIGP